MSNNIFSAKRFTLLCRQHLVHNSQLLFFSSVAYVGAIFIVLCIAQIGNNFNPLKPIEFQAFLLTFIVGFGILYAGHAFPAFRAKESAMTYLMVPASVLEKFAFEFVSRIVTLVVLLPLLYWVTFNIQGYLFSFISDMPFQGVGLQYLFKVDVEDDHPTLIYFLTTSAVLFAFSVVFTGAAIFEKQPLVKSLFAVALIVIFFAGYVYAVAEQFGLNHYAPPEYMYLLPLQEVRALRLLAVAFIAGMAVMLFVAFRKLKEREV